MGKHFKAQNHVIYTKPLEFSDIMRVGATKFMERLFLYEGKYSAIPGRNRLVYARRLYHGITHL